MVNMIIRGLKNVEEESQAVGTPGRRWYELELRRSEERKQRAECEKGDLVGFRVYPRCG